jgi:tetratricopeptide (TPR) repeat protein
VSQPFLQHLSGWLRFRQQRYEQALEHEERAIALCSERGAARLESISRCYAAFILSAMDRLPEAELHAQIAVTRTPNANERAYTLAAMAHVLRHQGRWEEALDAAEEGMEDLREAGVLEEGEHRVRLEHAEALAAAGRDDEAHQALGEARQILRGVADSIDEPAWREAFLTRIVENARTLQLARAWLD